MSKIRKALCCECGEIRTCHRPRNHQSENFWLKRPVDPNWHRELGDLKCGHCGKTTRHAIILPEDDGAFRDHAERITHIALGGSDPYGDAYTERRDRIREAYRQGRQTNPYLNHLWSTADEEAARKAGKATVITYCGEVEKLPAKSQTVARGGQLQPKPVRWDQDYEDPDTGGWWLEMDCLDCLRVVNERRMGESRAQLKLYLAWLMANYADDQRVPGDHVDALNAAVRSILGGAQ